MNLSDRLRALAGEIAEIQTELGILDEQTAFQSDVAEDSRIRALVSETPLADRDAQQAGADLERLLRSRRDALARLEALRAQQDALLERMLAERRERSEA